MSASAEFITNTVFAAIMVMIGLGAIWIVRWQTYFLLRHQNQDLECGSALRESSTHQAKSIDLANLTRPSASFLNTYENASLDVDGNNSAITDGRPLGLPTSSNASANIGQKPSAGILDNHQSIKKGPFVLRSGTSSRGLTRNQITLSVSTIEGHPTLAGVANLSSATLPGGIAEDSRPIGKTSFMVPSNGQQQTRNME